MGLLDAFSNQGIDIIRWENPNPETLVWKFPQAMDQIENDSSLIVDPGLASIFIQNGKIEAIQDTSGKWKLETDNTPFLSALKNVMSGFETHDKAQVYFVKTQELTNNKWGTPNAVTYMDPTYNFPVELRAFGNFTFKVKDIENFWVNYVANRDEVSIDDIRMIIVDRLVGQIGSIFAKKKISYNEIDAHAYDIAKELMEATKEEFEKLGFELTDFRIEDTNFTEKTEEFISKITEKRADVAAINATADVNNQAMGNYAEIEKLGAMRDAASSGGSAGDMMGAGMGMAMGMNMANQMSSPHPSPSSPQAPLLKERGVTTEGVAAEETIEQKLEKIKGLLDKGLISQDDYDKKKAELIASL